MAFTTVQFKKFAQAAVTTSIATIYTVPASAQDTVKGMDIANTTSGSLSVTVHFVPSGGSPSAATQIIPSMSIAANSTYHWTGTQVLNTGDTIRVIASNSGITVNISGLEST